MCCSAYQDVCHVHGASPGPRRLARHDAGAAPASAQGWGQTPDPLEGRCDISPHTTMPKPGRMRCVSVLLTAQGSRPRAVPTRRPHPHLGTTTTTLRTGANGRLPTALLNRTWSGSEDVPGKSHTPIHLGWMDWSTTAGSSGAFHLCCQSSFLLEMLIKCVSYSHCFIYRTFSPVLIECT